jgi:hypothetical protein
VYYHLKNPVLALQRIRRLLTDGGALFIEGASTTDYLAEQVNNALELPKSRMRTTAEILDRLPLFYSRRTALLRALRETCHARK